MLGTGADTPSVRWEDAMFPTSHEGLSGREQGGCSHHPVMCHRRSRNRLAMTARVAGGGGERRAWAVDGASGATRADTLGAAPAAARKFGVPRVGGGDVMAKNG